MAFLGVEHPCKCIIHVSYVCPYLSPKYRYIVYLFLRLYKRDFFHIYTCLQIHLHIPWYVTSWTHRTEQQIMRVLMYLQLCNVVWFNDNKSFSFTGLIFYTLSFSFTSRFPCCVLFVFSWNNWKSNNLSWAINFSFTGLILYPILISPNLLLNARIPWKENILFFSYKNTNWSSYWFHIISLIFYIVKSR